VPPLFFATPADWRRWLAAHHKTIDELWVGFHKKSSGRPSITWPESVDEALCFGWIDGLRKTVDKDSYMIRFTPRRAGSNWSRKNVDRVAELVKLGRMRTTGQRAFDARTAAKTGVYSFEQREHARLPPVLARRFKANAAAWRYFEAQAPWYRRTAVFWVVSAKRDETQLKRLDALIKDCAQGRPVGPLKRK
jgi:uncharacterized protein YdeI (YjbR/CyaY-like superfamily)